MTFKLGATACAALMLLGCVELENLNLEDGTPRAPRENFIDVPDQVREVVSPSQDLSAVKIDPIDGCYVYQYVGPVETTFLPLLTREGRAICTQQDAPAADEAAS